MKEETYKRAKQIEEQIRHLTEIIIDLSKHEYRLDPPTRMSNFNLYKYHEPHVNLNEGEVVVIRKALEAERERLQQEFESL